MYTRRIGKEDTDIMQHRSLIDKSLIKFKFGMPPCQTKSEIRNGPGMNHVNIFQFIFTWVVPVNYLLYIHRGNICSCSL